MSILVPLGDRHIHVGRLVVIAAVISVLVRVLPTIFLLVVVGILLFLLLLSSWRRCLGLLPLVQSAVGLDGRVDVLETLFLHICLALRLTEAPVTAQVHGVTVSIPILGLVNLGPWRRILSLPWREDGLLHHDLVLILLVLILEISPFGQDLHGLDVFNGSQFFSVVLVAAERVQVYFLAKSLVFVLNYFQDVVDLLAVQHFLIVHSSN